MYTFYPSRIPIFNSTEYLNRSLNATEYSSGGYGRSGAAQGAYQMAALCLTLSNLIHFICIFFSDSLKLIFKLSCRNCQWYDHWTDYEITDIRTN